MFLTFAIIMLAAIGAGAWWYMHRAPAVSTAPAIYKTAAEADQYVRFDMEAYDLIQTNYWETMPDATLSDFFKKSLDKATGGSATLATSTREGTADMLAAAFKAATSTDAKLHLAQNVVIVALFNLRPNGRNQLFSQAQEKQLRQEVSNINPGNDLYANLGLADNASSSAVDAAYAAKQATLAKATTTEAKQELAKVTYAHTVLAQPTAKQLYDAQKIEPTLFVKRTGTTLYMNMTRVSPTTLYEFAIAIETASTTPGMDSMIIDVRGNLGGALDFLQAFLGLFMGQNQYAFDLYAHDTYDPQRTTQAAYPLLTRYKQIAIITDDMTQSTAELTAATFKRYHLAILVGKTTHGWGTVENTYPITTDIDPSAKYALLLVNHITLSNDNQPIEGHGVVPDIDTTVSGWQSSVPRYFSSPSMIAAVRTYAAEAPQK